jgi:hypothetical protein
MYLLEANKKTWNGSPSALLVATGNTGALIELGVGLTQAIIASPITCIVSGLRPLCPLAHPPHDSRSPGNPRTFDRQERRRIEPVMALPSLNLSI